MSGLDFAESKSANNPFPPEWGMFCVIHLFFFYLNRVCLEIYISDNLGPIILA